MLYFEYVIMLNYDSLILNKPNKNVQLQKLKFCNFNGREKVIVNEKKLENIFLKFQWPVYFFILQFHFIFLFIFPTHRRSFTKIKNFLSTFDSARKFRVIGLQDRLIKVETLHDNNYICMRIQLELVTRILGKRLRGDLTNTPFPVNSKLLLDFMTIIEIIVTSDRSNFVAKLIVIT